MIQRKAAQDFGRSEEIECGTYRQPLVFNHADKFSPKRDPVRPAPSLSATFPGRSSALDCLLDRNGCGGSVEDKSVALRGDSSPAGNRKSGAGRGLQSPPGARRLLCWGGRAAPAEKVAGAPPVAGASRAPQGHLLENLGEVAGLQRASGGSHQGGQMGQNLPLCAQLGATRSRQDESEEVGEVGSKRTSSGSKGEHFL